MSVFEFYTVLLSFMVSLGVASLLSAIARLIQESKRVRFSWSYALWCLVVFNLMIIFWIKSWSYREVFELRVTEAGPPLLLAILGYLACGLATPHVRDEGPIDLDDFHAHQGRRYISMLGVFMLAAILQGLAMADYSVADAYLNVDAIVPAALSVTAFLAAFFIRVRWLQLVAPLVFLGSSALYYGELIGW